MNIPHPSEFIREEMAARGWSRDLLASAMCRDPLDTHEWSVNRLSIDLYFEVGPTDPRLLISPELFARAFGVSSALFENLERAWQDSLSGQGHEAPQAPAAVDRTQKSENAE